MPRKSFLILLLVAAIGQLNAQTVQPAHTAQATQPAQTVQTTQTTGPRITFDNIAYDFGTIAYNSPGAHVYTFTNTGTEPLLVTNCVKGCGCTSVEWTKELVRPGEKGTIKVVYNTHKVGFFSRGVDVYSNDLTNFKINLRLKGTVEPDSTDQVNAGTPAPKNNQEKW